jgi:predicted DNA-binding ribbon-helix-helix protein
MDRPHDVLPTLESSPKRPSTDGAAAPPSSRRPAGARTHRMRAEAAGGTVCQIRNVRVGARRTTLRLENVFWDAFDALCAREQVSVDSVLTDLEAERQDEALTSMVRSYVIAYWRRQAGA